jgi:hypothetical protein
MIKPCKTNLIVSTIKILMKYYIIKSLAASTASSTSFLNVRGHIPSIDLTKLHMMHVSAVVFS